MKLILIRHGDPDYTIDSLTEKGWKEAEYLSERIAKLDVRDFYVSPLGRARDTASLTLKRMNRTATECAWLREFAPRINRPDREDSPVCWDWLPQDWVGDERFYRYDEWYEPSIMSEGKVGEEYRWVTENFDALLAKYGYVRDGHIYRTEQGNNDTLVFFCHFGVTCVLIGHLIGVSPMALWHGLCSAPTSVSTIVTEERRKGIVSFRMSSFGDTSHLYVKDEPPAFSARFCECWENDERHD
ncbi:MAG: histidine phosphatase family protein [Lachnospiraceae bacterium]|nr:histidine phosphatase family protein [Lachnospiraceae bacterium]MCD8347328.1 histidine phosphatase family protein [Lachnospiraceae bacterium]